ncbi:PilZ domain-containing protein [Novosphingobium sp.]|uniref:PilZ domain-containing protein n=1 Tax=Novosphingobium sp. TaxID=1874826 RepID=UPI0035AE3ABF
MGFQGIPSNRHGARRSNRLRLAVPASLLLTHETRPCLIEDISATGAHIRLPQPLPVGRSLMLVFHELRLFATVVWSEGQECGLRFAQPLEREDMEGMLWIRENRELYDRICQSGHAEDWSNGLRD